MTFPNCSKYCFMSSTVVDAERPPTKIFFVFVIICNPNPNPHQHRKEQRDRVTCVSSRAECAC